MNIKKALFHTEHQTVRDMNRSAWLNFTLAADSSVGGNASNAYKSGDVGEVAKTLRTVKGQASDSVWFSPS